MRRNLAAWLLAAATVATGLANEARAVEVATEDTVVCGGVFGLRGWADWHNGWGNHASSCIDSQACVRGVLNIRLTFKSRTTGFLSADTDEHLLAQGIQAGVSAGPQTLRVSFYRPVIRGGRVVQQRVSCRDRAFRDPLSNLWLVYVAQP